jgi:hypothetical protein
MAMVLATTRTCIFGAVALGLLAIVPRPPSALAARVHGGCKLNAVAFATSDTVTTFEANGSANYARLPGSAVRFVQGKVGCATVSFSADLKLPKIATATYGIFEVEAVMDNSVKCDLGDEHQALSSLRSTLTLGDASSHYVWLFFCPRVSPGTHIITVLGKYTSDPSEPYPSEVHRRTLVVHYYR